MDKHSLNVPCSSTSGTAPDEAINLLPLARLPPGLSEQATL